MRRPGRYLGSIAALFVLAPAGLALLLCCRGAGAPQTESTVVASVNGHQIPSEVLSEGLRRFRREHGQLVFRTEEDLATVRKNLLDNEIERVLIQQKANRLGIAVDDELVERSLLRRRAAYPERTFEEYLVEAGIPLSLLRDETRHRLLLQEVFSREVNPRVIVMEDEIQEHFDADPSRWAMEEQVHARQIVVRTEEEASMLLRQLRRGEEFAVLAAKHSVGPEGERGGDLGWFTRGTMPPPIDDVCFSLPAGRLSDVIESPYGFHIFQIVSHREARPRELSEVSRTIANELRLKKEQEAQRAYLDNLRQDANLFVNQLVLAEVR